MKIIKTDIPGCFIIEPLIIHDDRGSFIKTFHINDFEENGLVTDWIEHFYSVSKKNVLRGLHFQLPPHDHTKLVYCNYGKIFDVVVDLRKGSSTYGHHIIVLLDADKASMIYIPRGLAHGFYTLSEKAITLYKVNTIHAPDYDAGIHWNSAGICWPANKPIVSKRDDALPKMKEFDSPFAYTEQ